MEKIYHTIWQEGMLMKQHHLQQFMHFCEALANKYSKVNRCGIHSLKFDSKLLALGQLGLESALIRLDDTTIIDIPSKDEPPSALPVSNLEIGQIIYLGISTVIENRLSHKTSTVHDSMDKDRPKAILQHFNINTFLYNDKNIPENFISYAIAKIKAINENSILLDPDFVAYHHSFVELPTLILLLQDYNHKLQVFRTQLFQCCIAKQSAQKYVSLDIGILELLDSHLASLKSYLSFSNNSTDEAYELLVKFHINLCSRLLSDHSTMDGLKHTESIDLPFKILFSSILKLLSIYPIILEIPIQAENSHRYSAKLNIEHLHGKIYLEVQTEENLTQANNFLRASGPTKIESLMRHAISGIPLSPLAQVSSLSNLNTSANCRYYSIDVSNKDWKNAVDEEMVIISADYRQVLQKLRLWHELG